VRNGAPTRGSRPRGCAGLRNAASRKEATTLTRATGLGVLLAFGICLVAAWADGFAPGAPEQWIAPLADDVDGALGEDWVEEWMAKWVVWPSDDEVRVRGPVRDRRAQFPEVTSGPRAGPGAVSPDEAQADAAAWVRRTLKPELLPDDLDSRFILLQEEDPSRSSVLCRFEVDETGIQLTQLRWAACVVVRAEPTLTAGLPAEALGPTAFRTVFQKGDDMARAHRVDVAESPPGLRAFDTAGGFRWWDTYFWYTDGVSVAVYVSRAANERDSARAGDPWF